jgi:hypothetical protein
MARETLSETAVKTLITDYLNICNRALRESVGDFWYELGKQINRTLWEEPNFRTLVYDQDPDIIIEDCIIHFDLEKRELSLIPAEEQQVACTWKVPLDYLKDVVENRPEWYIEHPVMLDWKWLTERTRTESRDIMRKPRLLRTAIAGFLLGTAAGALCVARHTWKSKSK